MNEYWNYPKINSKPFRKYINAGLIIGKVRENPKSYRSGNILIHRLICCKNGCGYWNRDVNRATNIYKIAYNAINNKERPNYLSRSNLSCNLSTGLD